MAKPKSKAKAADKLGAAVREAIGRYQIDIDQMWAIDRAIGDGDGAAAARDALDVATGATAAYLRVLAGDASPDDERMLAEMCTRATRGRVLLTQVLTKLEPRIDDALLARAVAQLEIAAPFAPPMLGRGRAVVRASGNHALADQLDMRAAFVARYAALLADLGATAKQKQRTTATAALARLAGADRDLAAHWVLTAKAAPREAQEWARLVAITSPAIPVLIAADALNQMFIHDDEEQRLGAALAAAGPAGAERATAILEEAIERRWAATIEHLAPAYPAAFATPRGFAAVMRGLADVDGCASRLCEEARTWVRALDVAQAAQVAPQIMALCDASEDSGHVLHHSAPRAMFYFANPGGLPAFAAALASEISDHVRDAIYDAVENIAVPGAQDLLLHQMFVEQRCLRDLVFAVNKACMPQRHADVLAMLDARPSFDAAWIYLACQMHWAHRPRFVLDIVERVLAWPPAGDPARRANVMSQAVICALELRRYELARRCLDLLGDARECRDPIERDAVETVLANKDFKVQLAALRSGKLEAQQLKQADEVAKLRAAGKPRAADDEQLGMLAGGKLAVRLHTDARTHEVWFLDGEGTSFYYDGFGIAAPPFELVAMKLVNGWDVEVPGLVVFCAHWRTEARSLHTGRETRQLLRCGERVLMMMFASSNGLLSYRVFGLRFASAVAAQYWFDAMHAHPTAGNRAVDPFYAHGRGGGTWVREYGNGTARAYVNGNALVTGKDRWATEERPCGSREAAIAAFDALEADHLMCGLYPRACALDEDLRPLDDMALKKWLDDRERDDEQTPGWHLQALPAMVAALEAAQLPLDEVEIELGPPATAAELAAYDATLPEPMPDEMRQMWTTASTAHWRVAGASARLLSPAEVLAERDARRADLKRRIANTRGAAKVGWQPDMLDVFVVHDDDSWLAYDIRQQQSDTWYEVGTASLARVVDCPLNWHLAENFASPFVDALRERFPEIDKLKYGETVAALHARLAKPKRRTKPKPTSKPKSKARKRR